MTKDRSWRRYLGVDDWPANDRSAWATAIAEGDILDGRGPAAHWAKATRLTNQERYCRWLGYLLRNGVLGKDCLPEDRVTPEAVRSYIFHLKSEVAPRTVVSIMVGLKVMMKAMAPRRNWRWLADVCNALNRSSDPIRDKTNIRPTGEIYAAALAELRRLLDTPLHRRLDRVAYRDALMLAFLTARPVRLKNFADIRIGEHLIREGGSWALVFPGSEVKNGQPLEYALPDSLVPFLEIYIERIRPSFLKGHMSTALWLTFEGARLDAHSIYWRFPLTTKRLLGVAINPHLLRDCAATSLSIVSPAAALSAAPLLGHRHFSTTERYYIRANRLEASRKLNTILASIRESSPRGSSK